MGTMNKDEPWTRIASSTCKKDKRRKGRGEVCERGSEQRRRTEKARESAEKEGKKKLIIEAGRGEGQKAGRGGAGGGGLTGDLFEILISLKALRSKRIFIFSLLPVVSSPAPRPFAAPTLHLVSPFFLFVRSERLGNKRFDEREAAPAPLNRLMRRDRFRGLQFY